MGSPEQSAHQANAREQNHAAALPARTDLELADLVLEGQPTQGQERWRLRQQIERMELVPPPPEENSALSKLLALPPNQRIGYATLYWKDGQPALAATVAASSSLLLHPGVGRAAIEDPALRSALRAWLRVVSGTSSESGNDVVRELHLQVDRVRATAPIERSIVYPTDPSLGLSVLCPTAFAASSTAIPKDTREEVTRELTKKIVDDLRIFTSIDVRISQGIVTPFAIDTTHKTVHVHRLLLGMKPETREVLLDFGIEHMHLASTFVAETPEERSLAAFHEQARRLVGDNARRALVIGAFESLAADGWNCAAHLNVLTTIDSLARSPKLTAAAPDHPLATQGQLRIRSRVAAALRGDVIELEAELTKMKRTTGVRASIIANGPERDSPILAVLREEGRLPDRSKLDELGATYIEARNELASAESAYSAAILPKKQGKSSLGQLNYELSTLKTRRARADSLASLTDAQKEARAEIEAKIAKVEAELDELSPKIEKARKKRDEARAAAATAEKPVLAIIEPIKMLKEVERGGYVLPTKYELGTMTALRPEVSLEQATEFLATSTVLLKQLRVLDHEHGMRAFRTALSILPTASLLEDLRNNQSRLVNFVQTGSLHSLLNEDHGFRNVKSEEEYVQQMSASVLRVLIGGDAAVADPEALESIARHLRTMPVQRAAERLSPLFAKNPGNWMAAVEGGLELGPVGDAAIELLAASSNGVARSRLLERWGLGIGSSVLAGFSAGRERRYVAHARELAPLAMREWRVLPLEPEGREAKEILLLSFAGATALHGPCRNLRPALAETVQGAVPMLASVNFRDASTVALKERLAFRALVEGGPSEALETAAAAISRAHRDPKTGPGHLLSYLSAAVPHVKSPRCWRTITDDLMHSLPRQRGGARAEGAYLAVLKQIPLPYMTDSVTALLKTPEDFDRLVLGSSTGIAEYLVRLAPLTELTKHFEPKPVEEVRQLIGDLSPGTFARLASLHSSAKPILYRQAYFDAERGAEKVEDLRSGEEFDNHYYYLGVPRTATTAEMKRSYRALGWCFHPDRLIGEESIDKETGEQLFKNIATAYDVLTDEKKRKAFDARLPNYNDLYPSSSWLKSVATADEAPWEAESSGA